ncbi:MAG: histidine phosphatase family protein [Firmicutes bacterium]|nr:histidine phosphatase family protein [Bacillota bacterium]
MTNVYFVRHAEPDMSVHDEGRPLTPKGLANSRLVTKFLSDKSIDIVFSSPFVRTVQTLKDFVESQSLKLNFVDDFRERHISNNWLPNFDEVSAKQWEDFSYKLPDGESLADVQSRNIRALENILVSHKDKNIVIGAHGTALSTLVYYFDKTWLIKNDVFPTCKMPMPWIVLLQFDKQKLLHIEKFEIISQPKRP